MIVIPIAIPDFQIERQLGYATGIMGLLLVHAVMETVLMVVARHFRHPGSGRGYNSLRHMLRCIQARDQLPMDWPHHQPSLLSLPIHGAPGSISGATRGELHPGDRHQWMGPGSSSTSHESGDPSFTGLQ